MLLWLSHHSLRHAIGATSSEAVLLLWLSHHWLGHAPAATALTTSTATHVGGHAATPAAAIHATAIATTATTAPAPTTATASHLAHLATLTALTATTPAAHLPHLAHLALAHLTLAHLTHLWVHPHPTHVAHLRHAAHSPHPVLPIRATKVRHVTAISDGSVTTRSSWPTGATLHVFGHHLPWSVDRRLDIVGDDIAGLGDRPHALLHVEEHIRSAIVGRDEAKSWPRKQTVML